LVLDYEQREQAESRRALQEGAARSGIRIKFRDSPGG